MMKIDPRLDMHSYEEAQTIAEGMVYGRVDSVAPAEAAATTSTPRISSVDPAPMDMAESAKSQNAVVQDEHQHDAVDIATIESLYASYAASFPPRVKAGKEFDYAEYFDPKRMKEVRAQHGPRLEKGNELAFALLKYYYPEDQGYRVEPVDFPLLTPGGWRTWVYPEDCYTASRRKGSEMTGPLKKNIEPVYYWYVGNINADKFHRILPEHITGYVVLSQVEYPNGSTKWAQHTYLAITMDDLNTFEHWVSEEFMTPAKNYVSMPRADILNDAMGAQAGISNGYAILMLGSRIEFYDYQTKPKWVEKEWEHYIGPDPDYVPEADTEAQDEETFCFTHLGSAADGGGAWAVDIRSRAPPKTFHAVDTIFRRVAVRDVHYRGGYSLPRPQI
ncbi:hypothetical protein BU23DRAFT_148387 [Bimuria novae-zelandiae CBS 107.79]|uniref:Uncharacterized protein n=1 Tax=Bimuria novae-zelandiae CBS 107.79 TaxID=1447943 RepID=A0A6A5VW60_9PLEO|nr:hypothetical protein BU23DRAFT_148387 [Bimuria novae-zelandiae CBS 107.79]